MRSVLICPGVHVARHGGEGGLQLHAGQRHLQRLHLPVHNLVLVNPRVLRPVLLSLQLQLYKTLNVLTGVVRHELVQVGSVLVLLALLLPRLLLLLPLGYLLLIPPTFLFLVAAMLMGVSGTWKVQLYKSFWSAKIIWPDPMKPLYMNRAPQCVTMLSLGALCRNSPPTTHMTLYETSPCLSCGSCQDITIISLSMKISASAPCILPLPIPQHAVLVAAGQALHRLPLGLLQQPQDGWQWPLSPLYYNWNISQGDLVHGQKPKPI